MRKNLYKLAAGLLVLYSSAAAAVPITALGGHVKITFVSTETAYTDVVGLNGADLISNHVTPVGTMIDLGNFATGSILDFYLHEETNNVKYWSIQSENPDNYEHLIQHGSLFGFEDELGGGDNDHNDVVFSLSGVSSTPSATPELATWAGMIIGLGAVGLTLRHRKFVSVH